MTVYNKYTPDFKCTTDGNGKGIVNANVGLLSYDEVVYAGGYPNQENNNYYLYNQHFWWTMSPNGFISTFSYSSVWVITDKGKANYECVDRNNGFRVVLVLKSDAMTTGTGTSSDPFVVE